MGEKSLVELGRDYAQARHRLFEFREEALPRCPHGTPCPCRGCGEPSQDDKVQQWEFTFPDGRLVTGSTRMHYCDRCGWGGCSVQYPVNDDDPEYWQDLEDWQDLSALDRQA